MNKDANLREVGLKILCGFQSMEKFRYREIVDLKTKKNRRFFEPWGFGGKEDIEKQRERLTLRGGKENDKTEGKWICAREEKIVRENVVRVTKKNWVELGACEKTFPSSPFSRTWTSQARKGIRGDLIPDRIQRGQDRGKHPPSEVSSSNAIWWTNSALPSPSLPSLFSPLTTKHPAVKKGVMCDTSVRVEPREFVFCHRWPVRGLCIVNNQRYLPEKSLDQNVLTLNISIFLLSHYSPFRSFLFI